ncbi:amidohydrolase [Loktanella sp. M215]|uniref:amidohydrolase n=1 Tax=Loktanella sp. M215 TaxID=2675431 RepID=UPI001F1C98D7|nr:amidohydrolase [Loktanella sp. M215]MCF7699552.1 amidohydrolase family protein [Loktanella sp. M215]
MTADVLIFNARTRPVFAAPGTTAIAWRDGVITALGDDATIRTLAGPDTQIIDAKGRELMPGFVESHLHLFMGGATLTMLDLGTTFGFEAVADAFAQAAKARPGDDLFQAFSVHYTVFGPDTRPDRHILDRISPDRPISLMSADLHCTWANTAALAQAGILHGADVGPEAEVVMGPDGVATGELREFAAMNRVNMLSRLQGRDGLDYRPTSPVAEADRAYDRSVIRQAATYCAAHGITSAVNMDGNVYQAGLIRDLAMAGDLPVRVSLPLRLVAADGPEGLAMLDDFGPEVPGWLRFGRVKMFLDGVWDTWTALTTSDYPGRHGFRSQPLIPQDTFDAICIAADARGLQIATHAVGDGAVRAAIDGYAAARRANGPRDARHRIEHIEAITPEDLERLAPLGITASMQPLHPPGAAGLPLEPTVSIMGRDRWATAFPWRMLQDRGVPLAFGSDWPVSPIDPLLGIHASLTRAPWDDGLPDQRISLDDCLLAYTKGGAYADQCEDRRGALRAGLDADLILIDGSLDDLASSPDAARVALTICGGRVTHRADT